MELSRKVTIDHESVYEHFRTRCEKAGISMRQLAKEVGVTPQNFTQWKVREPHTLITIRKMDAILKRRMAEKGIADEDNGNGGGHAQA